MEEETKPLWKKVKDIYCDNDDWWWQSFVKGDVDVENGEHLDKILDYILDSDDVDVELFDWFYSNMDEAKFHDPNLKYLDSVVINFALKGQIHKVDLEIDYDDQYDYYSNSLILMASALSNRLQQFIEYAKIPPYIHYEDYIEYAIAGGSPDVYNYLLDQIEKARNKGDEPFCLPIHDATINLTQIRNQWSEYFKYFCKEWSKLNLEFLVCDPDHSGLDSNRSSQSQQLIDWMEELETLQEKLYKEDQRRNKQ